MKFKKYLTEAQVFERGAKEDPSGGLTVSHGEAGVGVYGYVPSKKMRDYYTKRGEKLVKFTVSGEIVDLTKELDLLVDFAKYYVEKEAENWKYYKKPKINKNNVQRFPHIIAQYMFNNHASASAFIVPHKGPGTPTGKQIVVTKPEKIKIVSVR
jgi:hypothetical protein